MPVSATCPKCQHAVTLRSEFAGKRVKCPKCQGVVQLPAAASAGTAARPAVAAQSAQARPASGPRPRHNPLLDLLDEAGVEAAPVGDICPGCGKDVVPGHVICMECGYHFGLGRKMETAVMIDEGDLPDDDGRSDAEKRLAKAEREIDESPIGEYGVDFGEGKESFLIALVAIVALGLFVLAGVTTVISFDFITNYISSAGISCVASVILAAASIVWITSVALRVNPAHGLACILTGGLYCIPFGFMQGKSLFLPSLILSASLVIGAASAWFWYHPGEDRDSMRPNRAATYELCHVQPAPVFHPASMLRG